VNDLEPYVLRAYPAVAQLKEEVLANGAVYGAMSGSGSTVFGLHRQEPRPLAERPGQRQWILPL
jgi:4-diphosphocytidyl-2-C-methyl-D-erythritol kinase